MRSWNMDIIQRALYQFCHQSDIINLSSMVAAFESSLTRAMFPFQRIPSHSVSFIDKNGGLSSRVLFATEDRLAVIMSVWLACPWLWLHGPPPLPGLGSAGRPPSLDILGTASPTTPAPSLTVFKAGQGHRAHKYGLGTKTGQIPDRLINIACNMWSRSPSYQA